MSGVAAPAGVFAFLAGLLLVARGVGRLRRNGVFRANFWASFRPYAGYRVRALAPTGSVLLGLGLASAGLALVYLGVSSFYGARLGIPRP